MERMSSQLVAQGSTGQCKDKCCLSTFSPSLPPPFSLSLSLSLPRQTQVVTADYCELLYVEALRIRRIYEAHKDVMDVLLNPRSSSFDQDSVDSDGGERDSITPDSDLAMAGLTLIQLIKDHFASELIR